MRIVITEVGPKKIENTYYLGGGILLVIGVFWVSWCGIWHLGQCATCVIVSLLGVKELKLELPRLLSVASWVDCGKREG